MERRAFLGTLTGGLFAAPLAAEAQQAGKVYRVGLLPYTTACDRAFVMAPFRDGLRAAGYVEGQNIVIECRGGAQARDRLDDLAAELARLKVDVLIAEGTIGTLTAKRATSTIPIVMVYVADPVGSGLVASLAHPGGNVTGLSVLPPGLVQKALQILKEIAPRVSRMAVWMDATNPGQTHLDEELDAAAKILGITMQRTDIRNAAGLNGAFTVALEQRAEALFVYPLPIGIPDRQRIAEFGIKNRLPTVGITPPYIEDDRDGQEFVTLRYGRMILVVPVMGSFIARLGLDTSLPQEGSRAMNRKRMTVHGTTMITGLLIGLLMATASGCVRSPDWIQQTLVTVDVTGLWRGEFRPAGSNGGATIELTLQQSGPKVNGEIKFSPFTLFNGPIEGTVSGDTFRFRAPRTGVSGELQVNGDEMIGQGATQYGPGTMTAHR